MSAVNDLLEAIDNAPGEHREAIRVGRLLAQCQPDCPEWADGCTRFGHGEWIATLITEGRFCDRW